MFIRLPTVIGHRDSFYWQRPCLLLQAVSALLLWCGDDNIARSVHKAGWLLAIFDILSFCWTTSSGLSAWIGCNAFKWRINLFGFMLYAANILRHSKPVFPHIPVYNVKPSATYASSHFLVLAFGWLSFVSLSPSLSAFLLIPLNTVPWCLCFSLASATVTYCGGCANTVKHPSPPRTHTHTHTHPPHYVKMTALINVRWCCNRAMMC